MKNRFQKLLALLLALTMALALGAGVSAAGPYSVKVQNGSVIFTQNGYVTGSFAAADGDITLMTGDGGELLVCFNNTSGNYVGVTLGSQRDLSVSGTIQTLTLNSNYGGVLTSGALVTRLRMNGAATANLNNGVATLEIASNGTANVGNGTTVNAAYLASSAGRLNVNAGGKVSAVQAASRDCVTGSGTVGSLQVGGVDLPSGGGSTSGSSSQLRLSATSISADYGDRLRDLNLSGHVRAYDRATGSQVAGKVSWVDGGATTVTKDASYTYLFTPNNSRYSSVRGTVRVEVGGSSSGSGLRFTTSTIYADYGDELRDLEDDLQDNVRAYSGSTRVYGDVEWVSSRSTTVRGTKSYSFEFIPDSSKYDTDRGSIRVVVDDDDDDDDYDYYLDFEEDELEADYDDHDTLRDLKSDLRKAVVARDEDTDRKISGTFEWRDDDDKRLKESGDYTFIFKPSSSKYDSTRDSIYIRVKNAP